jgi:hypothetical protein
MCQWTWGNKFPKEAIIGSVLKELSLSKNSDHAYKAKEALDSLVKREGGMEKLLNSNDISKSLLPFSITSRIKPIIFSLELMVFC